jgi:hypothetical protein
MWCHKPINDSILIPKANVKSIVSIITHMAAHILIKSFIPQSPLIQQLQASVHSQTYQQSAAS